MTYDEELAAKGLIRSYKHELGPNGVGTVYRAAVVKQQDAPTTATKRKVSVRQPRSNNSLKPKAIEMLQSGKSVKEVALELGVTYANINYYKRFASK